MISLIAFLIISSITPGPSNILIMNEVRQYGFKRAIPFVSGVLFGFACLGLLSSLFTVQLSAILPIMIPYLKLVGIAYLLFMAYKIAKSNMTPANTSKEKSSFMSGMFIQLINVKSILFFLTVWVTFVLPYTSTSIPMYLVFLSVGIGWGALLLWAGLGHVFKRLFEQYDRPFRLVMSLSLVYTAISIV
ncbi:LysE family transporter [Exiguobacterium sp. MMG028]|uniref:LysE family transporter n=1 Tax=Exiguobacterium sp. MMG028 TaxID=3021979 RepID=UPI0022FE17B9|nr:LysE family transporter [Exiguobacterium sp. MMG028]MDA5560662.1 LysE family transporter [Exiguobacterium sp. MMG028]